MMKNPLAKVIADPEPIEVLIARASTAERAKASERVAAMSIAQRRLLNTKYRQDRLAGKISVPYGVWLVRLFEIVDAGLPVGEALSRMKLYLDGKLDGMPMPGTPSVPLANGAGG